MPERRWVAHVRVMKSIYVIEEELALLSRGTRVVGWASTHRIDTENAHNFVPFCAPVGIPSKLLCQSTCEVLDPVGCF